MKKVFNSIFIFLLVIILFASNKVYAEEWIAECTYERVINNVTYSFDLNFNMENMDNIIISPNRNETIGFKKEDIINYYKENNKCPDNIYAHKKGLNGEINLDPNDYSGIYEKTKEKINEELDENDQNTSSNPEIDSTLPDITTCTGLLGDPIKDEGSPAYYLAKAFDVIKYVALVLLIVLSVMDFTGAVAKQDKDALSKILKKVMMRFILCIIIFFLPYFVRLLLYYLYQRQIGLCGIGG